MIAEKTCKKCSAVKPLSEFHNRKIAPDGLNAACKECACSARRQYTADHPERLAAQRRLAMSDPEKRQAHIERTRVWRESHPEHRAEYERRYRTENPDKVAAFKRVWYEANREHVLGWAKRNPEKSKARFDRYREKNRDKRAEAQRRRRVLHLESKVEDVDTEALWTGACGLCAEPIDKSLRFPHPQSKSIDHIRPVSLGGTHEQANLQWAHLHCNISKGARMDGEVS
jgi:hypothetical protein